MARRYGMLNQMADFIQKYETAVRQYEPNEQENYDGPFGAWKRRHWEQAIQEALSLPECALS